MMFSSKKKQDELFLQELKREREHWKNRAIRAEAMVRHWRGVGLQMAKVQRRLGSTRAQLKGLKKQIKNELSRTDRADSKTS